MLKRLNWLFWETLIIVLGVLIALSVNDYWTDAQERKLELDYLKRMRVDIEADLAAAEWNLSERLVRKLAALDAVAPVVRGESPVPEDIESFLIEVSLGAIGGVSPSKWVTSTTFEDLTVTGNLRLIRDAEIRRTITEYYRSADDFVSRQRARVTDYHRYLHSFLPGELRENLTFPAMQSFGAERALSAILAPEFEALMNQEYNFAWFKISAIESQRDAASSLMETLDAYIKTLEE